MTERISLVEAYDNRDVIARLVRQQADIDMMMNILQNIDPDGDLTNVVLRTGDQSIAGVKTFTGKIVADCDIIQNGAAYETHAEQIYSHNDYMVMRDGQLNGLPAGSYSGLQVKKYNGSDDVRMVVDNTGIMRVGDINDERPIMVRDEAADLTDGNILLWDGTNQKAITAGVGTGDLNPSVIGILTANQNITGGVVTLLPIGSIDDSTSGELFTYDAGTQKFTAVRGGRYLILASVKIQGDTVGKAEVAITKNSTVEYASAQIWLGAVNTNFVSTFQMVDKVVPGDTFGLCGWVASGNGIVISGNVSHLEFIRLGD